MDMYQKRKMRAENKKNKENNTEDDELIYFINSL